MQRTRRGTALLLLAGASLVLAYAFETLAPAILAVALLGYAAHARLRFQQLIDDVGFEAEVFEPDATVFQDETTRVRYRLRVRPPGLRVGIGLPQREDLEVDAVDAQRVDTRPAGERFDVRAELVPRRRGRHRLGALEVELADPDGLFERTYEVDVPLEFTAHAPVRAVREGAQFSRLEELAAAEQARPGELSLEILTHRPYRPSDRDRDIDWKTSARRDELLTRIFQKEVERPLVILVDCTRTMRYQRGESSPLDHASKIATAIARGAHDNGSEVGLAAYDEHSVLDYEQPSASPTVPKRIADIVARLPEPIELAPGGPVVPRVPDEQEDRRGEPSTFEKRIAPFLGGDERIPLGIARAADAIGPPSGSATYLVLTTLTHRPHETLRLLTRLNRGASHVIVGSLFAPFFLPASDELTADELAEVHQGFQEHRDLLARLEATGIEAIELPPSIAPQELIRYARRSAP